MKPDPLAARELPFRPGIPDPALSLRGITALHDGRAALEEVSVDIPQGMLTAITGANGSGKSTMLGVIAGTHPPHRGIVHRHRLGSIAFVVQRSAVTDRLPITVRETVAIGRWRERGPIRPLSRADREIVDASLEALAISDLARRPLAGLSGGQRQRALVAQGLAQRADVLLLDEPTAGIDVETQALVHLAIESEIARGVTVVQATHDAAVADAAALVVRLHDGRLDELVGARPQP